MKLLLENWRKFVKQEVEKLLPHGEVRAVKKIGSSTLSPEEQAEQDLEKYGYVRDEEDRDFDIEVQIAGVSNEDVEEWAFSEKAAELEDFYNYDVQLRIVENWRKLISEEEWRASGEEMMFPAKYLFSHMGEYRTERWWRDFANLPQEEKVKWAEGINLEEPIEVTVFADGTFGHGDGHHRAMAGKILDVEVPIIISRNKLKQKSDDIWSAWISRVREGNSPKELNPEGYNINSLEQIQ